MNLSELHHLRIAERQLDIPQELPDSFYDMVIADLDEFRGQLNDASATSHTEHQLEAYETELSNLHQRRVRKLIRLAEIATNERSFEARNLVPREQTFFSEIKASIEAEQERLFSGIAGIDG